jgi:hypothetical protein
MLRNEAFEQWWRRVRLPEQAWGATRRGLSGRGGSHARSGLGLTGPADPRAAATPPRGVRVGQAP